MITAIRVNQDTRSCQGETLSKAVVSQCQMLQGSKKIAAEHHSCWTPFGGSLQPSKKPETSSPLQHCLECPGCPAGVLFRREEEVSFVKGNEERVFKEMQAVVTVQLCRKLSVKHEERLGQQKANVLSFLQVRKTFGQLTIGGRKQWCGEIKTLPHSLAHLSKSHFVLPQESSAVTPFSALHTGSTRTPFWYSTSVKNIPKLRLLLLSSGINQLLPSFS